MVFIFLQCRSVNAAFQPTTFGIVLSKTWEVWVRWGRRSTASATAPFLLILLLGVPTAVLWDNLAKLWWQPLAVPTARTTCPLKQVTVGRLLEEKAVAVGGDEDAWIQPAIFGT